MDSKNTVFHVPLVDVQEAARTLCISPRYLRLLISRGAMPVVRIGRRVLVRRRDIDALIDRGGVGLAGVGT